MKKSILISFLIALVSSSVYAEGGGGKGAMLTGADFMTLSEGQRHWWLGGAFMALGQAASLQGEGKAECVWAWYFDQPDQRKKQLEEAFKLYPTKIPTSIIMAYLRKECSVF